MCGIAGFWCKESHTDIKESIAQMTKAIEHRGPDDEGYWVDPSNGVALGHRRLAILDLSPAGHQPMISHSGRYVLIYNGEIYNYKEIFEHINRHTKRDGYSIAFKGTSDTEVILAAIEIFGLEDAVKHFVGMFAFALYDRRERKLSLVRDRLGEKPLYYGYVNSSFVFASELKAIRAYPDFNNEINRGALALYFRYNYVPTPYSIYEGIGKLPPGTILTVDDTASVLPEPKPYWTALDIAVKGISDPFDGCEADAVIQLEKLLRQSIRGQMISDVPLGAFLSGGIDSTLIVALMQEESKRPVKTFTIGFNEKGYNEAEDAKKVAAHLGTEHTELYISPGEAMGVIPKLPDLYDEPFSDSSQIPTFLVSELARKYVTVSLSGDGGDELFGGYNRYFHTPRIWSKIGWIPQGGRRLMAKAVKSIHPATWDKLYGVLSMPLPSKYKLKLFGDKLHKLSDVLASDSIVGIYNGFISHWKNADQFVHGSYALKTILSSAYDQWGFTDPRQLMMFLDTVAYLPDDILVKVDRAAMGVSLETRVPFLDHRVVEFAWRLPLSMKFRDGKGKHILRQILYQYVPKELIERPKMGFGVPIGDWMRGPMREWAETLLNEKRLNEEGLLNAAFVQEKWKEHLSGSCNWQYYLWDVLMFEAWLDKQKNC